MRLAESNKPGEAALLFLTGMCEYEIEGNGYILRLK